MKVDKFEYQDEWKDWVGLDVTKHSKKPFKSGKLIERVVEFTTNPHSGKAGFKLDDESIVDCHQVKLFEVEKDMALKAVLAYHEYLITFIDTDNIGIGMTTEDVLKWYKKEFGTETQSLSIPDIRNKLSPIKNMIAMLEDSLYVYHHDDKVHQMITKEMKQSKKSIEYLSGKL